MAIYASQWLINLLSVYFIFFGLASFMAPEWVKGFLLAFASSFKVHILEMTARLVCALAFVVNAPQMKWPFIFEAFGWVLVITTLCLLLLPWQKHRQFAERFVPPAIKFIRLIGSSALFFGVLLLFASYSS